MVPALRALNAQWVIIAPRAPIYKISTPVQQGLLIPTQEWAAVMTVYPALQVPFLQATELLSSHFSVLRSSYSQRVMLPYFFKAIWVTPFSVTASCASSICQNSAEKCTTNFFLSRFLLRVSWTVWMYLDRVQLDTFVSLELCLPTPVDGGTGGRCPQGHYCPIGSSFPEPCPEGYYSNSSRNTQLSDCVPCPPGQYYS